MSWRTAIPSQRHFRKHRPSGRFHTRSCCTNGTGKDAAGLSSRSFAGGDPAVNAAADASILASKLAAERLASFSDPQHSSLAVQRLGSSSTSIQRHNSRRASRQSAPASRRRARSIWPKGLQDVLSNAFVAHVPTSERQPRGNCRDSTYL